jgi:hypothetical protein
MKNPWLASVTVLMLSHFAAGMALEQHEVAWAVALYWGGFAILFLLSMRWALILHAEKKAADALRNDPHKGLWLAPLSRKVDWTAQEAEPGALFCFWQGEPVHQTWKAQGDTWEWIQNTTKDVWPKELEFQDGMRWWKGLAIYKKADAGVVTA